MSCDEVRHWLEANGFGQWAELFQSHGIDADALPMLSEQHLREIGVPMGPRVKLLAALARLPLTNESTLSTAERRRLTVMFVDLVGSTALSTRLDPEDLRKVIRTYQIVVAGVAARFEAHVAQYLGDGAMLYFGYPVAHEDDAERAVRAALEMIREIAGVTGAVNEPLAARIGIATGLVVVGDVSGNGAVKESGVVGETPNLAARLQTLASPGEVIVSGQTRSMIGRVFEFHDLGVRHVRGIDAPVAAFRVMGERSISSRFEARRAAQSAQLVGRERELAQLQGLWDQACAGTGQFALVTGEAGIGKSRTVHALLEQLEKQSPLCLHHQCSPYHSDSPLFPVTQQMMRAGRIKVDDAAELKLERLETLLSGAETEEILLISALLGIDASARHGALDLPPQQQRLRTFDALMNRLARLSVTQPVIWILEDAHWIDPTTLELLQRYVEQIRRLRLLVIVTARPEFRHDLWPLTQIDLERLNRSQATTIVNSLARGKSLPVDVVREIVLKADGIPLFIEELTKAMFESAGVRETEHAFVVDRTLQRSVVPASLHDSLMARLDRLQPFKEVAQTAACIGREFEFTLLARACRLPQTTVREALKRLEQAGLIFSRGGVHRLRYAFKHALVRDAAYESLLNSNRRRIHARLAEELESTTGAAPEVIAQHAAQAQLAEKAIKYWQTAAVQSMARPAYREAIAHLTQAIVLADAMDSSRPWQERRLSLWMALGQASIPLYGYSHSKTAAVLTRAQELAEAIGDPLHRFWIQYATWVARYVRGEQDAALKTAHRMMEQSQSNEGWRLSALRALGISQMVTGTPAVAKVTFEAAASLADVLRQRSNARRLMVADRFAADPEIATQFHVGLTLWSQGYIEESQALVSRAVAEARLMGHAHTIGHAVTHGAIFAVVTRDVPQALRLSAESIEFAEKHDMELWRGYGHVLRGAALALQGDSAGSVRFMDKGFVSLEHTQTGAMVPMHHAVHACTLVTLGRLEHARKHAAEAERELRTGSERYFWPEIQRLLGNYLRHCASTDVSEVENAYTRAMSMASEQHAVAWQLYAAISLARLWMLRDEYRRAADLIGPLVAPFRPMSWRGYREANEILDICSAHG